MIIRSLRCVGILVLFIGILHFEVNAEEFKYYVSPDGNDSWTGNNIDKPFATIQKARNVIRIMKKQGGLTKPVTVYLRGGIYRLSEPIIFTPEDSGTELCPVIYTAYSGEEPVIIGDRLDNGLYLSQLVIFKRRPESGKYVEYISICGITFSGTESLTTKEQSDYDNKIINSSGINLKYARHCIFKDNKIKSLDNPAFQITGDENKIIGNNIYDAVGGAICVKGNNFIIKNNVIRDIRYAGREKPGWGICLDSATTNVTIENNIVVRAGVCLYLREKNKDISIKNNVFVDGDLSLIKLSNPKNHNHENIKISRNIFYYRKTDVDLFNISGQRSLPEVSDYNIFWNPTGCIWLNPVIWGIRQVSYFPEWQALGFDAHSIVKDPLFFDIANDDYSIKPKSPAFKVGFKPIDLTPAGLSTK